MERKKNLNFFSRLTQKGYEVLSKKPKSVNVKIRRPVSDHQRFRQWLDAESKKAALSGSDTYDEFMNFGSEEEDDIPQSQFETVFDPLTGKEMYRKEKDWLDSQRARYEKSVKEKRKLKRDKAQNEPRQDPPEDNDTPPAKAPKIKTKAE